MSRQSGVIISHRRRKITPNAAIGTRSRLPRSMRSTHSGKSSEISTKDPNSSPAKIHRRCATWRFMDRWVLQSPAFPSLPLAVPTYQLVAMPQSDTFKVSNHLRAWFENRSPARVCSAGLRCLPPGPTPTDNGLSWSIPSHLLLSAPKAQTASASTAPPARSVCASSEQPVTAISAGVWECRYASAWPKRTTATVKHLAHHPIKEHPPSAHWQVRKVAGKKTLANLGRQVQADRRREPVGQLGRSLCRHRHATDRRRRCRTWRDHQRRRPIVTTHRRGHHGALDTKRLQDAICCGCATTARCSLCPARAAAGESQKSTSPADDGAFTDKLRWYEVASTPTLQSSSSGGGSNGSAAPAPANRLRPPGARQTRASSTSCAASTTAPARPPSPNRRVPTTNPRRLHAQTEEIAGTLKVPKRGTKKRLANTASPSTKKKEKRSKEDTAKKTTAKRPRRPGQEDPAKARKPARPPARTRRSAAGR